MTAASAPPAVGQTVLRFALYTVNVYAPFLLAFWAAYNAWSYVPRTDMAVAASTVVKNSIPWFFVAMAVELAVSSYRKLDYYRLNDSLSSIFAGLTQQTWTATFIRWFGYMPYLYVYENFAFVRLEVTPITWLAMFVLVEYAYYWLHRLCHEWNAMWAGHVAHHSSEDYNLSTALRQGFVQSVFAWIFSLPLAFFFPPQLYFFHQQLNTVYQFWIHTQLIGKLPWPIEFVFNTPSHHRVHHGRNAQYIDKNYGGTLILFDRLFGTFEPEGEPVIFGITHSLDTWDPIYTQMHHFEETWQASQKVKGSWLTRLRMFVDYGPGDNYVLLHNGETPSRVMRRYDGRPGKLLSTYAGLQAAVLLLGVMVTVLDANAYASFRDRAICCMVVTTWLYCVLRIFDRAPGFMFMEAIRLFTFEVLALALLHVPGSPPLRSLSVNPTAVASMAYTVASLLFLAVAASREPASASKVAPAAPNEPGASTAKKTR